MFEGQETEIADVDVEEALASVEQPSHEIPMSAPEPEAPAAPQEYEFVHSGKPIKAPIDKILKWASQGYDAPNRIGELNKTLDGFKSREQKFTEYESKYAPVDEYFTKNPDHWKAIQEAWTQRQQALDPNNPIAAELNNVKQTLNDLTKFKDDLSSKEVTKTRQAEDAKLTDEITSIRKQYSDLDWDQSNEQGLSLEKQVLKHGMENGISSFRAAFRDFTHDQLVKKARESGMQERDKDIQKRTKLGLLGETRTPTKGITPAKDVRNQSYEELMREGLEELRAGQAS